ncbi:MAG: twin-arginine translocase TatA/TatE family subunit [Pyrinomonadaceae bacterium]
MLLFLESLGTTELLLILVVALMIFGPRKLPELARSLGKSLNQFKQASDDFKRTWEREVEVERVEQRARAESALLPEERPEEFAAPSASEEPSLMPPPPPASDTIARGSRPAFEPSTAETAPAAAPARKSDWL